MKSTIIVLLLTTLVCCTIGLRSSGLKNVIPVNTTVGDYLEKNFPDFTNALKQVDPALWAKINDATDINQSYTVFAVNNTLFNITGANSSNFDYHVHGPGPVKYFNGPIAPANFSTLPTQLNGSRLLDQHPQVLSFQPNVTINGKNIGILVNRDASVVEYNLLATNGMVHSISKVLPLPSQDVVEVLSTVNTAKFTTLAKLVHQVNFSGDSDYLTLLAPTDDAFTLLFETNTLLQSYLASNFTSVPSAIISILSNHVLNQTFYSDSLSIGTTTFHTIAGNPTYVSYENGQVTIRLSGNNGVIISTVVDANYIAQNGATHVIDKVLVPSNVGPNLVEVLTLLDATEFLKALSATPYINETTPRTYFVPTNNVSNILDTNYTDVSYYIASNSEVSFSEQFYPTLLSLSSLGGAPQNLFTDSKVVNNVTVLRVNGVPVTSAAFKTVLGSTVYLISNLLPYPQLASHTLPTLGNQAEDYSGLLNETSKSTALYNIDTPRTTLFVPTNEAFSHLPLGVVGFLRLSTNESVTLAQETLDNHAVLDVVYPAKFNNNQYRTANPEHSITLNSVNGTITINGNITVNPVPVLTANGLIYTIDDVILAPGTNFNALDLLDGLAQENMGGENIYGNYSNQIAQYNQVGLTSALQSTQPFTLFAYTNQAWDNAAQSFSQNLSANQTELLAQLRAVLLYGLVDGDNVADLNQSNVYIPNFNNETSNSTLVVTQAGPGEKTVVTLYTQDGKSYPANVVVNTTTSYGQKIYGLDRVLGLDKASDSSSGKKFPTWAIVLIIVVGVIIGLILLALICAAVWYFVIRPNREGYRALN